MLNRNHLADYYRRRHHKNGGLTHAWRALDATRRAAELGKISPYSFAASNPWRIVGGVNPPMRDGCRWIENPNDAGLRFVGYADELANLRHTGWFIDPDIQDETARGAVYQMPARGGCAQYVPAMLDPHNDGPALFDFSNIHVGEQGGEEFYSRYDHKAECARAADSIAENFAEREREYVTAWRAGVDYADKGEEMAEYRKNARAFIASIRGGIRADAMRRMLCGTLENLQQLRAEREELREPFETGAGFNRENRTMLDAFRDGAGIA